MGEVKKLVQEGSTQPGFFIRTALRNWSLCRDWLLVFDHGEELQVNREEYNHKFLHIHTS